MTRARPTLEKIRASLPAAQTVTIQGLSSLANFILTWWLVRKIGVDGFGHYAISFIVAINVTSIVGSAIVSPINSLASRMSPRRQAEYASAAFLGQVLLVAGLIALVAIAALAAPLVGLPPMLAVAAGALAIAMCMGEFWRRMAFFHGRIGTVFAFDLVRYAALIAVLVALARAAPQADATVYTLAIAATYPAAMLALWPFTGREERAAIAARRKAALLRRLLRSGRWLAGVAALRFVDGGMVLLIAAAVLGPYEVGLLRLADTLVGITSPAIQTLEHTVPRWFGQQLRQAGEARARIAYRKLALLVLAAFALGYAVLALATPWVLELMGVNEADAGKAFWLVCGYCLVYLAYVAANLIEFQLRAFERSSVITLSLVVSAILSAVLAYPLIAASGDAGMLTALGLIALTRTISIVICYRGLKRTRLGL